MNPLVFAVVLPTLLVAHNVADHWIQTGHQAACKGSHGWPGRLACARHVATYTATTAVMVGAVWWLFALPIDPWWFVAGQVVSAVTHYWADRRFTLEQLCERIGKGGFYRLGMPRLSVVAATNDGRQVRLARAGQLHTGLSEQWDNPTLGTGAYALDQSWHWAWLWVAALVTSI